MTTCTVSTALCTARTGPPLRGWRRGSHRSRARARTCGRRWCGFPSTSRLRAPTPSAGHRWCSACTVRMCSGTTWSGATGPCMSPSPLAGTERPSPCSSQSPHPNCRSSPAGSWDGGPSTRTPRWWRREKAGK
uniref:B9 domain containing 1 n=1 Tax=Oryctolagus cuniculus TaxID=9986 RepID=A0A5F9CNJ8_RABIT